jgi:hypothetical protein
MLKLEKSNDDHILNGFATPTPPMELAEDEAQEIDNDPDRECLQEAR